MKILLTGDLHSNRCWFRWLEDEAHKYALISIAGYLLDMFSKVPLGDQLVQVEDFLQRLAEKTPVAVCSGNHDAVDVVPPLLPGVATSYGASWLEEMSGVPGLIGDGQTRFVGNCMIVTDDPVFPSGGSGTSARRGGKAFEGRAGCAVAIDRS